MSLNQVTRALTKHILGTRLHKDELNKAKMIPCTGRRHPYRWPRQKLSSYMNGAYPQQSRAHGMPGKRTGLTSGLVHRHRTRTTRSLQWSRPSGGGHPKSMARSKTSDSPSSVLLRPCSLGFRVHKTSLRLKLIMSPGVSRRVSSPVALVGVARGSR